MRTLSGEGGQLRAAIVMPLAEQRGGSEVMLRQLVEHTPAAGPRWLVIFLRDGPMVGELRRLGAAVEVVEAGRLREPHRHAAAVARIAGLAHRRRADVIVGWMVKSQLYAGPAALLAGLPVVWYQLGAPSARAWLDRAATALPAAGILAVSETAAQAQAQIRPRRPVRVVHPGVELGRFDPARLPSPLQARARLGLPQDRPLVGIVGRLQHWKGMHVLVDAMARIAGAHCVIVGGGHDLEPDYPALLERQIAGLGLQGSVTLAGLQPDVALWMQAMDVVVHASDREPFGIVLLEAMALGKPVVAGSEGGPREIVSDGVDGVLTPFGDRAALASAILRYLDDPGFARAAGVAARTRAADFGVDRYARNVAAAVGELASARAE
jgi:glycosyltransferase involved in cell wall biosynthesis